MFVRCLGSGSVMTEQGEHFGLVWEGLIKRVVGDRYLGLVGLQRKVFVRGNLVIYSGLNSPDGGQHL